AVVAAIAVIAAVLASGGKKPKPAAAGHGEIFLQPAAATGSNAYTMSAATVTPTAVPAASPTTITAPAAVAVQGQSGAAVGLYGGTRDQASCNPAQMVAFLQQDPAKAGAWVAALNSDPTLRWSGGTQLTVADIPQYVAELTPVILREDTRVTNHGYANGAPTTLQSVLQAGTAVMVDAYGIPRVRCACGNPLDPPIPVDVAPTYTGDAWPAFTPPAVVVVEPPPTIINVFTLVDLNNPADGFTRPVGTSGASDGPDVVLPAPPPGASLAAASPSPSTVVAAPAPSSTPAAPPSPSPAASTPPAGTPAPNVDATREGTVSVSSFTPGYPASLAVDGDPTTSWFSTGDQDGPSSTFTWTHSRDDLITLVRITGNQDDANPSFRQGFGFNSVTLQILNSAGAVVYSQNQPGPNDQAGLVSFTPGVTGRTVRLVLNGHISPSCGGFSELYVGVTR
ncbi:MAG TPA: discoidin domain-containing protein, partial [Acidimicrobiia bacterium]|nr:discoidin domain-containing protein [Acidimicrobiia bacterium]